MRQCCKVCGIPLIGRYRYDDFDEVQYHAWMYHPDIMDSYPPQKVRDIIEREGLETVGVQ